MRRLGDIYGYGGDEAHEIDTDFDKSAEWHLRAAKQGDAKSQQ